MWLGRQTTRWLIWLQLLLLLMPQGVRGECCRSRVVSFKLKMTGEPCELYDSKPAKTKGECRTRICGDGTHVRGTYCGKGPCNIFGCNCKGGCRDGDTLELFTDFYGDYHIHNVHFV